MQKTWDANEGFDGSKSVNGQEAKPHSVHAHMPSTEDTTHSLTPLHPHSFGIVLTGGRYVNHLSRKMYVEMIALKTGRQAAKVYSGIV